MKNYTIAILVLLVGSCTALQAGSANIANFQKQVRGYVGTQVPAENRAAFYTRIDAAKTYNEFNAILKDAEAAATK